MKISKPQHFKLRIEDVKYYRKEDGTPVFTEWTGYGPVIIPFSHTVFLKRGTRKPQFTMQYGKRRVLTIDVREYLKNHLSYLSDKEEKGELGDYSENLSKVEPPEKPRQLDLFEDFCQRLLQ